MSMQLMRMDGTQRLAYGALAGLATTGVAAALGARGMALGLLGWSGGVAAYLLLALWLAHRFDAGQVKHRARSLDPPAAVLLGAVLATVVISLAAIAMLLGQVKQMDGAMRAAHVALALVSLAGSWLMIHTMYAFHYAHSYYQDDDTPDEGGLEFPGKDEPDYADFMYYAFVVGMTSQVSDVQVSSREMRRTTLVHSILSFGFNMLVLALSINVVAGII
ncbi:DUF1345 domain-containing protein [Xenophilus aerolatus]|nr:DUF1345 domain-containing protein [Xenophilus aerolatus]